MNLQMLHPKIARFCQEGEIEFKVGAIYQGAATSSHFPAEGKLPVYSFGGRLERISENNLYFSDGSVVEQDTGLRYSFESSIFPLKHRLIRLKEVQK